jgi:predicted Zn-dependent protease
LALHFRSTGAQPERSRSVSPVLRFVQSGGLQPAFWNLKQMRRKHKRKSQKVAGPAVAEAHLASFRELQRIAERVLKLSDADETEVSIDAGADALTRFANNTIHQNLAEKFVTISVRTVFDGRTARATTNKSDDASLRRVIAASSTLARRQPRDPDLLPMPGPQHYPKVNRYFEETAKATPWDRAWEVAGITKRCGKVGQTAAGAFSTGASRSLLANSHGLRAEYEQTKAEFSISVMQGAGSGWAKESAARLTDLYPVEIAARARGKASVSGRACQMPPGRYTVVLEPSAALDLIGFLFYDFSATAVADQRSCFHQRLGRKLFGSNITLWDDVKHPQQLGAPFDGEGMPRKKVTMVEHGVPRNLVYSRAAARKAKVQPTGHGLALPNEWGEAPVNLVFEGGNSSVDEMAAGLDRGIYVTRLWYIREVDPYEKIMTGMTRDGTFLIENGQFAGAVRNLRFNQSILELLNNVALLGPAVRACGEESFDMVIPAMKVQDFHCTEVTKF